MTYTLTPPFRFLGLADDGDDNRSRQETNVESIWWRGSQITILVVTKLKQKPNPP